MLTHPHSCLAPHSLAPSRWTFQHPLAASVCRIATTTIIIGIVIIGITRHRHLPSHLHLWQSPLSSARTSPSSGVAPHHQRPHHCPSLCFCAPSASNAGLCSFASCSLPLLVLAAAAAYCICWEHPTLAPAVLTGTALLQLLLQLCLSCYSAADCTDFSGC